MLKCRRYCINFQPKSLAEFTQGPCLVRFHGITVAPLTANLEYQMKSNYKTTSTTPHVNRETNLMRPLTARLENSCCSITVVNHQLIIVIRFVAKSYTHP